MGAGESLPWVIAMLWLSRAVLVILVALSVWSIATMIRCYRQIKDARGGAAEAASEIFAQLQKRVRGGETFQPVANASTLYESMLSEVAAVKSREPERIDRTVRSHLTQKKAEIEKNLTVLATLGSNAPFIGLFGTVLGIIQAFGALGANQSSGASVMVGISEALVATAVGLFVAIPAVVAFNFFSRSLRVILQNCESLRDLYVARGP